MLTHVPPDVPEAAQVRHWTGLVDAAVVPLPGKPPAWRRTATGEEITAPAPPESAADLVLRLRSWIYQDVHLGGPADEDSSVDDTELAATLRRVAVGSWVSPGWTPRPQDRDGRYEVRRGTLRLSVPETAVVRDREDSGQVAVRLPRARPGALFGWFAYTGPTGPAPDPGARLYLHPRRMADADQLSALLGMLGGLGVPWQSKFAVRGPAGRRPDSVVVYLAQEDLAVGTARLMAAGVEELLRDPVPGFSHRLGTGLAAAVRTPGLPAGSFGARMADLYARMMVERPGRLDLSSAVHGAVGGSDG